MTLILTPMSKQESELRFSLVARLQTQLDELLIIRAALGTLNTSAYALREYDGAIEIAIGRISEVKAVLIVSLEGRER